VRANLTTEDRYWRLRDLDALPADALKFYEILKGELVVRGAPGRAHQWVSQQLLIRLPLHVSAHKLGEVYQAPFGVILDSEAENPDAWVLPDLLFVSKGCLSIVTEGEVRGVPDLMVEILSPGTEHTDRNRKSKLFAEAGVPHYWIVDPIRRTLEAFQLGDRTYRLVAFLRETDTFEPVLFPGLSIPLGEIWPSNR
jgi:Uma2 family endonuclease